MDDYIAREAFRREIAEHRPGRSYEDAWALTILDSTPSADVRPVVFCRDCKRYGGRPWENNESGICARTDVGVGEFDFCSYGEKREES